MNQRNFGLDLLRSISIFLVFMSHLHLIFPPDGRMQQISMFFSVIDGVTIFFVLSGFLVGYRLIELFNNPALVTNGGLSVFLISRWCKTLPSYYVILFLLLLLRRQYISENNIPIEAYAFFIQNFNTNHPAFFEEAWSLSVEEWFYLTVPLLLTLLIKVFNCSVRTSFLIICVAVLSISHLTRFFLSQGIDTVSFWDFGMAIRGRVIARIDAPIYGAVFAYYYYYYPLHFKKNRFKSLLICGLLLVIQLMVTLSVYTTIDLKNSVIGEHRTLCVFFGFFYFDIAQACAAFCIPWLFYIGIRWRLTKAAVTFVSKVSYSIYLVHSSLVIGACLPFISYHYFGSMYFGGGHKLLLLSTYLALVTITTLLLYYFVEMPFFRAKKRWMKRLKDAS